MNEGSETARCSPQSAPRSVAWWAIRIAAAVAVVVTLLLFGSRLAGYLPEFSAWVEGLGLWGPVVFVLGYAVATVAFIPGSLLTLAGGAIFGLAEGTAFVFVGACLGATAAFLASRYKVRGAIERRVASERRFAAIDRAVGREGFKIVLLLRLTPVVPFVLLNYALGLTGVKLRDYLAAFVGMLPATLLYVYIGKAFGDVAEIASGVGDEQRWAEHVAAGIGLAALIAVVVVVTRIARRALKEEVGE